MFPQVNLKNYRINTICTQGIQIYFENLHFGEKLSKVKWFIQCPLAASIRKERKRGKNARYLTLQSLDDFSVHKQALPKMIYRYIKMLLMCAFITLYSFNS